MFNLNFSNKYKVVHINNELGNCVIGGAGTYMNELYRYRSEDVGFIYMGLGAPTDDYNIADFMEQKDGPRTQSVTYGDSPRQESILHGALPTQEALGYANIFTNIIYLPKTSII